MRILIVLFILLNCVVGNAQKSTNQTPEMVIAKLFDGLRTGDSTMVRACFHKDCTLKSIFIGKEGNTEIQEGSLNKFIEAIGTPHPQIWDERVSNLVVKSDAQLAHAWMDYSFYLGDVFSHCGVNAMHLVLVDGDWLIYQLMDTRRKTDCN